MKKSYKIEVDCCSLESEGFQSGYGRALEHQQNGFMGL